MNKDKEIFTSQCIMFEEHMLELLRKNSISPRICVSVFGEILIQIIISLDDPKDGLNKFLESFKGRFELEMMKKYPVD